MRSEKEMRSVQHQVAHLIFTPHLCLHILHSDVLYVFPEAGRGCLAKSHLLIESNKLRVHHSQGFEVLKWILTLI